MARRALDGEPPITTRHGEPGYGYFGRHAGYDYGVVNWPVKAPESGVITAVYTGRENVDGGNIVELRSGTYDHRFLHLKQPLVSVGQQVSEGQAIAISGNTGNVGYHLHHDTRAKGTNWQASYSNYVDWEQIIKQQGGNMIPDTDNWYARMNKLMHQIRNRANGVNGGFTRDEFRKNFVGVDPFRMVEIISDHPEADRATYLQVEVNNGDVDNILGELWGRKPNPEDYGYTNMNWKEFTYGVLGSYPWHDRKKQWAAAVEENAQLRKSIEDLQTALLNEKNKPPVEVIKEVEKIVYTHDVKTQEDISAIKSMVTAIFDYFKGQYKTFSKYIKKEK